jgi:hypothetical protein
MLALPSGAYLLGALLFSAIGFIAWRYGKSTGRPATQWLGVALMLYPYVVPDTAIMYAVGTALCFALYYYRS